MSGSPILVTGGCGYIGAHVVFALLDSSYGVVVLDDLSTGFREALPAGVDFIHGDIRDGSLLSDLFKDYGIAAVIHAAAVASVPESVSDPARCYAVNVDGTHVLLEAMVRHGVEHLVFSSTSGVYDEATPAPFAEGSALGPLNPYARSKLQGEEVIASFAARGLSASILRYFNVGGADPSLRAGDRKDTATTLIKSAFLCALGKRPYLSVFGTDYDTADGTCIRDYVHVSDIASGHILALRHLFSGDGGGGVSVFNLGVGRGFSVREVIAAVKRVTGIDFALRDAERRAGDPTCLYADMTKAQDMLSFRPLYEDLDVIVRHGWAWERHLAGI